ncbi:MAG: hypothetical protein A2808_00575 [Candidatus Moranbacteria bacterium RIFCSPHIGHO2_01_FULL_55_24]|nr:MAG: hypothetical protein A2808_00575 [Candidatus Moranbacteria bacterium RIFCSPHIGHO2_01_FULL_55_24]
MTKKSSKNIKTVLEILQDEINGDVSAALKKMAPDYSMTWVEERQGKIFPSVSSKDLKKAMGKVYKIKGREYDIKNIAEGKDLVMIELVESYPDPKTKKVYRTPQVIVLEMKNGKIQTGRHYADVDLAFLHLTKKQIEKAFKGRKSSMILK